MPLSVDAVEALLTASAHKPKEQAFIFLLQYSGLSIRDVATLKRTAVDAARELALRRSKTNELVTAPLPDQALAALEALPPRPHYF